jgi:hypothetical protein
MLYREGRFMDGFKTVIACVKYYIIFKECLAQFILIAIFSRLNTQSATL